MIDFRPYLPHVSLRKIIPYPSPKRHTCDVTIFILQKIAYSRLFEVKFNWKVEEMTHDILCHVVKFSVKMEKNDTWHFVSFGDTVANLSPPKVSHIWKASLIQCFPNIFESPYFDRPSFDLAILLSYVAKNLGFSYEQNWY